MRIILGVVVILSAIAAGPAATEASVTSMEYGKTYSNGQEVAIWRNKNNRVTIKGQFLDLHTKLEVRRNGALVSDPAVSLVQKSGGSNTFIIVDLGGDGNTPLGDCELWVRYLVETNGPDKIKLHVFDRGTISSLSVTPRNAKVGETIRFEFTGTGLSRAHFPITNYPELNNAFTEVAANANDRYAFTIRAVKPRPVRIVVEAKQIVDRTLPSGIVSLGDDLPGLGGYKGTQFVSATISPNPTVTGVSPVAATVGGTATIGGQNLEVDDPCYRTIVSYNPHPEFVARGDTPQELDANVTDVAGSFVKFRVPDGFVPGSFRLSVRRLCDTNTGGPTANTQDFTQTVPVFFANPTREPSSFHTSFPGMTGAVDESASATPMTSQQRLSLFNSNAPITMGSNHTNVPKAALAATFAGKPLTVVSHEYSSNLNTTRVSFAGNPVALTGRFTISNGNGTATTATDFVFIPPPSGANFAAAGASIRRSLQLTVTGTNIGVSAYGHMLNATLSFNDASGARREIKATPISGTTVAFILPATVVVGPIRAALIGHFGGQTPVLGSVTITE